GGRLCPDGCGRCKHQHQGRELQQNNLSQACRPGGVRTFEDLQWQHADQPEVVRDEYADRKRIRSITPDAGMA
ncbi:MAG: hypothetical protein ACK524_13960, partial [Planctomyces sp.]